MLGQRQEGIQPLLRVLGQPAQAWAQSFPGWTRRQVHTEDPQGATVLNHARRQGAKAGPGQEALTGAAFTHQAQARPRAEAQLQRPQQGHPVCPAQLEGLHYQGHDRSIARK